VSTIHQSTASRSGDITGNNWTSYIIQRSKLSACQIAITILGNHW